MHTHQNLSRKCQEEWREKGEGKEEVTTIGVLPGKASKENSDRLFNAHEHTWKGDSLKSKKRAALHPGSQSSGQKEF